MIICSCNVLSEGAVRASLEADPVGARTVIEVYHCLGCRPRCGRCARSIRAIIEQVHGETKSNWTQSRYAACSRVEPPRGYYGSTPRSLAEAHESQAMG
ncbi:MAG: (2Fe-2S)-binding protein [Beijerinckiaceae bacterium]|nr:(2Fe-2S)-binding protein [Beijerinckiaceae bacterium]